MSREIFIESHKAAPMEQAFSGKRGKGLHMDYRGHEVLAVWKYLPSFDWGIAVKIDNEEAFAPYSI